jgi:hypothetical protein
MCNLSDNNWHNHETFTTRSNTRKRAACQNPPVFIDKNLEHEKQKGTEKVKKMDHWRSDIQNEEKHCKWRFFESIFLKRNSLTIMCCG